MICTLSREELEERVHSFLKDIIEKHQGHHVVVVTHAEIITVIKHFFTREDPRKLTGQPLTSYATPEAFYWDYSMNAPLDLHKETVDGINWTITSPEEAVHLTVVRHGESDWNAEKRICGKADRPLTEQGETQAKAFAANVKKGDYDVLLCSNLERAKKTASYISESLSLEALVEDIFTEQDFGSYEGKTLEEIKAIDEGFAASFKDNLVDMPQGESADGLRNRAREAIRMLRERYKGKRVMVVAHGRFISAMKQVEKGAHGHVLYPNCHAETFVLAPKYRRIPDVLDCWFESGSMPYAQSHYPFEAHYVSKDGAVLPPGFPADFIAEGIDQTRGWFYTLTVLSAALFDKPAFEHCVVNGTVLAEDGKKMSKRLKNYPEPLTVVEKHGADAVRFALMQSPAVRGEDLRFSERLVEETLRNVLLPFWNTYSFFVTYANAANWEPQATRRVSNHPLDQWILSEMQDLVNRMTKQLDAYDLSATCTAFVDIIDNLTNWYVRLSRRRFAGKGGMLDDTIPETSDRNEDQQAALATLYDVLLTLSQLLAPFCPFMTDAMYLNLTGEPHGSVHLTRWPKSRELSAEEQALVRRTRLMRLIVSLGLGIRSDVKIKVRQPLAKAVIAMPPDVLAIEALSQADLQLLRDELNVKSLEFVTDPGSLAIEIAQVDARKAGPRLGKNVQTVIQAGKKGEFTKNPDGSLTIAGETLAPDEVTIMYRSTEGDNNTAGDRGVVIRLDTTVTDELKREGDVRDLIRGVQRLRKEQGLEMLDTIQLAIENADDLLEHHGSLIERETNATLGDTKGANHTIELDGRNVTIRFVKR
jgi:broad specificity phosphatase PhoE